MFCLPEPTDNANVNFVKYKGDYYVSTETKYMRRVNPQSLETKEKVSQWEMCLLTASSIFSIARSMTRMVCMLFFLIRWTGVSISLSTQLQPIHTTTAMVPRTTWATHTAEVVTCLCSFLLSSLLCWAMIGIYMMFTPQKLHSCNAFISSYLPHTHAHVYLLPTVVPQ